MNGLDLGSSIRSSLMGNTVSAVAAQPQPQKVATEEQADEFTPTKAPKENKKRSIFGIFGDIARTYKKGEVTVTEGAKGITDATVKALAVGAGTFAISSAYDIGTRAQREELHLGARLKSSLKGKNPFKAAWKLLNQKESILSGTKKVVTLPYTLLKNFLSDTDASGELVKRAKVAAKDAKKAFKASGEKGFFNIRKEGTKAFEKTIRDAGKTIKLASKRTRITALGVGLLVLGYGVVKTRLAVNRARHGVDAGFIPTPIIGTQHHNKKVEE